MEYLHKLARKKTSGCKEVEVMALPVAKMGHPLLIGENCDKELQECVLPLRDVNSDLNTVVVRCSNCA